MGCFTEGYLRRVFQNVSVKKITLFNFDFRHKTCVKFGTLSITYKYFHQRNPLGFARL